MSYNWSYIHIGKIIKQLRQKYKLSQEELAKGICSQAHISKIERGIQFPSGVMLYLLAQKLRISVDYLFNPENAAEDKERKQIKEMIRKSIRFNDYEQALKIIADEQTQSLFSSPYNQQFLLWAKAGCLFYYDNKPDVCMKLLKEALKKTTDNLNHCTEQELLIINSVGIIFAENKKNRMALKILLWVYKEIQNLHHIEDQHFIVKNTYACARSLYRLGKYEEAIHFCNIGVKRNYDHDRLYLLGEVYYIKGLCCLFLNYTHLSIESFKRSLCLFHLKN